VEGKECTSGAFTYAGWRVGIEVCPPRDPEAEARRVYQEPVHPDVDPLTRVIAALADMAAGKPVSLARRSLGETDG